MPDDFLNSVFQNCNELWGAHNAFDNAPEGTRWAELFNLVMVATQRQSDLLHAAAMLGIDLTPFSAWLVVIQKAHLRAGQNGSLVDEHADDSWPSVHAVIQRLRYAAGAAIQLAADAAKPAAALPAQEQDAPEPAAAKTGRRGRLTKDDSEVKRVKMMAILATCPDLRDNLLELGNRAGVSESTARRWLKAEDEKYHQSKAAKSAK